MHSNLKRGNEEVSEGEALETILEALLSLLLYSGDNHRTAVKDVERVLDRLWLYGMEVDE